MSREKAPGRRTLKVFLVGAPNVGKSVFFNRLAGVNAIVSNYPGTTVEVMRGLASIDVVRVEVVDLPGTYSLGCLSEDQEVAVKAIIEEKPDVVVNVVDATRLEQSLILTLQLLELNVPLVVALNQVDFAKKKGFSINHEALSELLGVPVIPTVATKGINVRDVLEVAVKAVEAKVEGEVGVQLDRRHGYGRRRGFRHGQSMKWSLGVSPLEQGRRRKVEYSPLVEGRLRRLERAFSGYSVGGVVTPRILAEWALEGDLKAVEAALGGKLPEWLAANVEAARHELEWALGENSSIVMSKERFALSGWITRQVMRRESTKATLQEKLDVVFLSYSTGIPVLALILTGIFALVFLGGGMLERGITGFFENYVNPSAEWLIGYTWVELAMKAISSLVVLLYGEAAALAAEPLAGQLFPLQTLAKHFVVDGLLMGVEAALSVALPYVATFYLALALLEDTGYLSRIAYLTDLILHKFGLHGKSIIPLVSALGCNVPAIMSTRILESRKQKLIVTFLITLLPCSARTAVILGAAGHYGGLVYALAIYMVVLGLVALLSVVLSKVVPGESPSMLMEMPPYRFPSVSSLLFKTWIRTREFFKVALPFVVAGSLMLALLEVFNLVTPIMYTSAGFMSGALGLPSITSITFIYGVLRKEMAIETLLVISKLKLGVDDISLFMTPMQIFIYALVVALYFPCVATFAVIARELNTRVALLISAATITAAILVGAGAYHAYLALNPLAPEPLVTLMVNWWALTAR
ncbi:MAG: ferrous iron transport protein B [Candidatus Freyarchaeota archaeon]|nr:ferrous iron transport protein B [Candidatus Jordarchaeia archaeon]